MTLGVLGGLGPGATVQFMEALLAATPAERDQDHLETVVYNDPTVPDRTAAIRGEDDVGDQLVANARALDRLGVDYLVIASNLTHYWYDAVDAAVEADVVHVVRAACAAVEARGYDRVGLLTTSTAREIGLYEGVLEGVELVYPDRMDAAMDAIYAYKAGRTDAAGREMAGIARDLAADVDALVLGCTEFSAMAVTAPCPVIDPLAVVARDLVELVSEGDGP